MPGRPNSMSLVTGIWPAKGNENTLPLFQAVFEWASGTRCHNWPILHLSSRDFLQFSCPRINQICPTAVLFPRSIHQIQWSIPAVAGYFKIHRHSYIEEVTKIYIDLTAVDHRFDVLSCYCKEIDLSIPRLSVHLPALMCCFQCQILTDC